MLLLERGRAQNLEGDEKLELPSVAEAPEKALSAQVEDPGSTLTVSDLLLLRHFVIGLLT